MLDKDFSRPFDGHPIHSSIGNYGIVSEGAPANGCYGSVAGWNLWDWNLLLGLLIAGASYCLFVVSSAGVRCGDPEAGQADRG